MTADRSKVTRLLWVGDHIPEALKAGYLEPLDVEDGVTKIRLTDEGRRFVELGDQAEVET